MEIHPPTEPILTWKQAAVHLAIITAGILIALSFEGVREWREHRGLANEARANLLSEIADNRKEVANAVGKMAQLKKDLTGADDAAQKAAEGAALDSLKVGFNYSIAQLRAASRATAEATGAFAYMEYEEVKDFATVYDLQAAFAQKQERTLEGVLAAFAPAAFIRSSPTRPTAGELDDWKRQIRFAFMQVITDEQIGNALVKAYDDLLARHR
jgi:hypothetical protein